MYEIHMGIHEMKEFCGMLRTKVKSGQVVRTSRNTFV